MDRIKLYTIKVLARIYIVASILEVEEFIKLASEFTPNQFVKVLKTSSEISSLTIMEYKL